MGANPLSWMRYDDAMQDRNKINKDIGFYSEHPGSHDAGCDEGFGSEGV